MFLFWVKKFALGWKLKLSSQDAVEPPKYFFEVVMDLIRLFGMGKNGFCGSQKSRFKKFECLVYALLLHTCMESDQSRNTLKTGTFSNQHDFGRHKNKIENETWSEIDPFLGIFKLGNENTMKGS